MQKGLGHYIPLSQAIDAQHAGQVVGAMAISGLGIKGFDSSFELVPEHDLVHFGQEYFATGLFLLCGLFEINEAQLLVHRHSSVRWDDGF